MTTLAATPERRQLTWAHSRLVAADLTSALRLNLILFAAIMVVIFAAAGIVTAIVGRVDGTSWESIWEHSAYGTRYFPLSLGIMLAPLYLPIAVASGMTRRSFAIGSAGVIAFIALAMGILEVAGYLVEHAVFAAQGAEQTFTTPHLFSSGLDVPVILVEVLVTVSANIVTGWLIGIAYYRWGWFWPTISLPLLLLPMAAVEAMMSVGWPGNLVIDTWGVQRGPAAVVVPASIVVIVAAWAFGAIVLRSTPIRNRRG